MNAPIAQLAFWRYAKR